MYKIITTTVLSLAVAMMLSPIATDADIPLRAPIPTTVKGMIEYYANEYGAKVSTLNFIIDDESGFQCIPAGSNDQGKAFGPAQYHEGTFRKYAAKRGETMDYHSCHDQIKLLAWQAAYIPSSLCEWTKWKKTYCG